MRALAPLAFVALLGVAPAAATPLEGRWDITIDTPDGPRPAWLEVRHSGTRALVGQFMSIAGSARPIAKVYFDNGSFRFSIPPQWDQASGDLSVEGRVDGDGMSGSLTLPDGSTHPWTGKRAPTLRRDKPVVWGAPVRVFNGRDLSGWKAIQGKNNWVVANGVLRNTAGGANLQTERTFNDFKLHIEVRFPKGGNSGVYLRGRYEVQVEDSPGPEPAIDGLGAVYGLLTPNQFVSKGPDTWHAYDITLVGRTVTIAVNGTPVIIQQVIPGITGGALDSDEGTPGPIFLQGDHGPVEYRNVVITPAR